MRADPICKAISLSSIFNQIRQIASCGKCSYRNIFDPVAAPYQLETLSTSIEYLKKCWLVELVEFYRQRP
jgi:hypothetical protein